MATGNSLSTMSANTENIINFTTFGNTTVTMTFANTMENFTKATPFTGVLGFGELEYHLEFWVAYYINLYYLWVYIALGIAGNMASFITIVSIKPATPSTIYIATLAVSDTIVLILKLLYLQLTLHDIDMKGVGCKILSFLGTVFVMFSNWILVSVTSERFVAIRFPLKAPRWCTIAKARITLVTLAVVLSCLCLHMFFTIEDSWNPVTKRDCGFVQHHSFFMEKVWYWIDGLFYAIIPLMLLLTLNVLIIISVRRSTKSQRNMTLDKVKNANDQVTQLTVMLLAISIAFVILNLPNCIFFIVQFYWNYRTSSLEFARYFLISQIVFLLSDLNHCINFVLYVLSGRKFRNKFMEIACCKNAERKTTRTALSTRETAMSISARTLDTYTSNNSLEKKRIDIIDTDVSSLRSHQGK